jgi:ComF family protein
MEVLDRLLETLFPACCVGCGRPPVALCSACLGRARRAAGSMGATPPSPVDRWVAVFAYEGAVREALARLKYRNARSVLPGLAAALVERLREEPMGPVDVVTWPPTTAARRRERGFDQAEHLARAVGRGLGVPVRPCLARRAGPSQTGRSAEERRHGPGFQPGPVTGLRVLVVDDVATTGATLAAAARALRSAGARWVGAATVARTPRRIGPPATSGADRSPPAQATLPGRRDQLMSRGLPSGRGPPSEGAKEIAMERTNPLSANRHDVIVRLRQQVADGAYQPPVDELVNRLVSVVMARRAAEGPPRSQP